VTVVSHNLLCNIDRDFKPLTMTSCQKELMPIEFKPILGTPPVDVNDFILMPFFSVVGGSDVTGIKKIEKLRMYVGKYMNDGAKICNCGSQFINNRSLERHQSNVHGRKIDS
jgi:hypothetical protein